mmetsp:Transcript_83869/g.215886  ORF Transcript_83869/g.215886 Transcript_83869/m.215886 type:complete len:303 (-) Transcript_83869:201-1109(-)
MVGEVSIEILAVERLHLVVHHGHAATQRRVDVGEETVRGLQNLPSDLDRRGESGAHHGLDGRGILRGQRQCIALAVDRGRVDGVSIAGLQVLSVLHVGRPHLSGKLIPKVLDHLRVARRLRQGLRKLPEGLRCLGSCNLPGQLLQQNDQLALRHAPEVLDLLQRQQQVQVLLEGTAHLVGEDRQAGDGGEHGHDAGLGQHLQQPLLRGGSLLHNGACRADRVLDRGKDLGRVHIIELVVVDLQCGRRGGGHQVPLRHLASIGHQVHLRHLASPPALRPGSNHSARGGSGAGHRRCSRPRGCR